MYRVFDEEDQPYLAWLSANPHGYVANIPKSGGEVVLHKAMCRGIREVTVSIGPNPFTSRDYFKISAADMKSLDALVAQKAYRARHCKLCSPSGT
jgi:hypothetical protein